jgi:hypothetical protein
MFASIKKWLYNVFIKSKDLIGSDLGNIIGDVQNTLEKTPKELSKRISIALKAMMDQLIKEGISTENVKYAATMMVAEALAESNLDPNVLHDMDNGIYTGYGIYGARLVRRDKMLDWLTKNNFVKNSLEGQSRYMIHEVMNDSHYTVSKNILLHATENSMFEDLYDLTKNFESPKVINDRTNKIYLVYQYANIISEIQLNG